MNLRNLAIWAVLAVVGLGLYGVMTQTTRLGGGGNGADVSYSQLLRMVDSGQVRKATIHGDTVDVQDPDGKTKFSVTTPYPQDDLVHHLEAQNVDFSVKPSGGNPALALLINLLPVILIAAVWFFFMRQMQGLSLIHI